MKYNFNPVLQKLMKKKINLRFWVLAGEILTDFCVDLLLVF